MEFKMIALLLPALLLLRGLNGAITRHDPKGDACTLEKYEGGDGTVDISKCYQKFAQFLLRSSVIANKHIFMSDISSRDEKYFWLKNK